MKQKLLEVVQVLFHTDDLFLFGLSKTETGAKTAPPRVKTGLHRRTGAKTQFTGDTRNGAGVVCHEHAKKYYMEVSAIRNFYFYFVAI